MPLPDRLFRTEAVILRRYDFGEADRLLTLYTPEYGKLRAIAKGARRPNGRQTGHVELFTRAKMLIARGRELHVVSQAEMIDPYLPLHEDLERGGYAHHFVELLDNFTEDEEQNRSAYELLRSALSWISEADHSVDLQLAARFYELKLLELVGFQPALFRCAMGQEEIRPTSQFFSVHDGGIVCPEHAEGRSMLSISFNAVKTLRYLQTRDYETVRRLKLDPPLHTELERVLHTYIVYLLEQRLKSAEFIRRVRRL
jgi:DNA repair protein RecO (recombination protein O)